MQGFAVIAFGLLFGSVWSCHTFNNTNINFITKTGERFATPVTGCLERTSLNATVTEIYIKKQQIPLLETDSIRHLRQLVTLSLEDCHVKALEAGAFRNVPKLQLLKITFNDFKNVLKGTFSTLENLQELDLSHNKINHVETGAFGNSTSLKKVRVGFNQLKAWSSDWFQNATHVKVIDFQHNKFKILPTGAFYTMQQLYSICFDYNELEVVQPGAFQGLKHLEFLGLRYNKLRSVEASVFPNEVVIKRLMIDANYLSFLPSKMLAKIQVKELGLFGNPWKCPCLDQIHSWLHNNNATVKSTEFCAEKDVPVCSYPSTYSHACRETVEDEVINTYLEKLRKIQPPLHKYCARLDN